MRPNLFKIATSELTQDAFYTWLIQWADPACEQYDSELNSLGLKFIKFLLGDKINFEEKGLLKVEAGRQWENIDVWAKLYFKDNINVFIILEDKIFAGEHSNQLKRYKITAEEFCYKENFQLFCSFVKIGSEPLRELNRIQDLGFLVRTRIQVLQLLSSITCKHPTVVDYIDYVQQLENAYEKFKILPIQNWDALAWIGFYQYVEKLIPINTWHYISNPSGGFWNLCLTWNYWKCIPLYTQIEQGRLNFKIAVGEEETGQKEGLINQNAIQDFLQSKLMAFSKEKGINIIARPHPFVHRGCYRTIGVISRDIWLGAGDEVVDLNKVIENLMSINNFHSEFVKHMSQYELEYV